MDHFEMVEKLRDKANVTYEEAKAALEAADWDLLDALVYLENDGKLNSNGAASFTTKVEPEAEAKPEHDSRFKDALRRVGDCLTSIISKGNAYSVEAWHKGKRVVALPLTAFALLVIFMFWWVIPLMIVGLFFGFTYKLQGERVPESFNSALDKAAQMAEQIKQEAVSGKDDAEGDSREDK